MNRPIPDGQGAMAMPMISGKQPRAEMLGIRGSATGPLGTPLVQADPMIPLPESVLKHLEQWAYREQGDDFGEMMLEEGMLSHLEEWSCEDATHALEGFTTSMDDAPVPFGRTGPSDYS
jgi:hypothetical protein